MKKRKLIDQLASLTLVLLRNALPDAKLELCHGDVIGEVLDNDFVRNVVEVTINGRLFGIAICCDGTLEISDREHDGLHRFSIQQLANSGDPAKLMIGKMVAMSTTRLT